MNDASKRDFRSQQTDQSCAYRSAIMCFGALGFARETLRSLEAVVSALVDRVVDVPLPGYATTRTS